MLEVNSGESPDVPGLRHHKLELVLQSVFFSLVGDVSQGLKVAIFNTSHEYWPHMDQPNFLTELNDNEMAAEEVVGHAQPLLQTDHPGNDYKELLQLTVIFMGGIPGGQQRPSLMSHGALY